jgi:hypothetical protein
MTSILIDSATKVLLAISENPHTIVFASESMLDTIPVHAVENPTYLQGDFLKEMQEGLLPAWTWTRNGRQFIKTPQHVRTGAALQKSLVAMAKVQTIGRVMEHISRIRYRVMRGVDYQDVVHLIKLQQAEAFRATGYDEKRLIEFPYVVHYADLKEITLKQAADDIIIKAKLDADYLMNTESIRMKYFNIIKKEENVDVLSTIVSDFLRECYRNTLV